MAIDENYKSYIEMKLSRAGFYIEERGDSIVIWPRGSTEEMGAYHLAPTPAGSYSISRGRGPHATKKFTDVLNNQIKRWNLEWLGKTQTTQ
jgi:hypothetical protein